MNISHCCSRRNAGNDHARHTAATPSMRNLRADAWRAEYALSGDARLLRQNEIGEVFISGSKAGSTTEAVARDGAVLLSIALQHGVPLETIKHALTREGNGTPSTIIGAVVDRLTEAKAEDEKSAQAET